jgi:hypothetical protein
VAYSDEVLADSPKIYLRLGEPSGTTATNDGSLADDAFYVNSPTLGETGAIAGNTAVRFDRSLNQYLDTNYDAGEIGISGNHDLTVECWWKRDSAWTGNYGAIWGLGSASSGQALYFGYVGGLSGRPNNRYEIGIYGGLFEFDIADDDTEFHHVVARFNAATDVVDVRVDGAAVTIVSGSGSIVLNLGTGGSFQVGRLGLTGDDASGWVDEVAVYDTRLSDARVTAHYDAAAGLSTMTGTGASTLAAVTSSASGSPRVTGSSSPTLAAVTSSAAGQPVVTGTSSATLAQVTSSASGSPVLTGTSAATLAAVASEASGNTGLATLTGTGTSTLAALVSSATGTPLIVGTGSSTLGAVVSAATDSVTPDTLARTITLAGQAPSASRTLSGGGRSAVRTLAGASRTAISLQGSVAS